MADVMQALANCQLEFSNVSVFELAHQVPAASIDVILCVGLIAHVGRLEEMFSLCNQLLKPNGHLIFQTTLLDHPGNRIIRRMSEERHIRKHGYAIQHYWHNEIQSTADSIGLHVEDYRRHGIETLAVDDAKSGGIKGSHHKATAIRFQRSVRRPDQ